MIDKAEFLSDLEVIQTYVAMIEDGIYDAAYFNTQEKLSELQFVVSDLLYASERMFLKIQGVKDAR